MSPVRKAPVEEAVTEPGPETEPTKVDHDTLIGAIKEVLGELGITSSPTAEPVEGTNEVEETEELETPRQQESRMRKAVESSIGQLHIHVDGAKDEPKAKEAEQPPGKKPWLERVIGL